LEGFLEAADIAFKTMKKPTDILLLDMDNHAKAIVATQEQTNKHFSGTYFPADCSGAIDARIIAF
jgi:hypothetical protein